MKIRTINQLGKRLTNAGVSFEITDENRSYEKRNGSQGSRLIPVLRVEGQLIRQLKWASNGRNFDLFTAYVRALTVSVRRSHNFFARAGA